MNQNVEVVNIMKRYKLHQIGKEVMYCFEAYLTDNSFH